MSEYTPTTEEIIRSFSIPTHRVIEQLEGESFSEYLARLSIEGHGNQMESEAAARRWLAAHDAEVRYRALREAEEAAATSLTTWWLTPTSPDDDTDSVLGVRRAVRALHAAGDREYRTVNGRTESRMKEIPAGHWVPVKQEGGNNEGDS